MAVTSGIPSAKCQMLTTVLLHFLMRRVFAARPAELAEFQPARRGLLILGGGVIAILAITALQRNNLSRHAINPFRLPRG